MKNGDLRFNLLEAVHRRRNQLRKEWILKDGSAAEYRAKVRRLEHWFNYRLAKLTDE